MGLLIAAPDAVLREGEDMERFMGAEANAESLDIIAVAGRAFAAAAATAKSFGISL